MTKFDAEKILRDLSEEEKQRLIEKLIVKPKPKSKARTPNTKQDESDFTMKPSNAPSSVGGTPVNETPRTNTFVDDGTESVDITTPPFTPTERRRAPYKPVEQTCQKCSKTLKINPTHARENYTCDKCLGR